MTVSSAPTPWGKLDRTAADRAGAARLSLVGHCIDVAAVARALLELPTWRARLQRLAEREFSRTDLDRLTVLAFLHDVGKAGAGFYSKGLSDAAQAARLRRTHHDRSPLGHTLDIRGWWRRCSASHRPLPRTFAHRQALGGAALRAWGGVNEPAQEPLLDLWMAPESHHGEPISVDGLQLLAGVPHATWTEPIEGYDPLSGLTWA